MKRVKRSFFLYIDRNLCCYKYVRYSYLNLFGKHPETIELSAITIYWFCFPLFAILCVQFKEVSGFSVLSYQMIPLS